LHGVVLVVTGRAFFTVPAPASLPAVLRPAPQRPNAPSSHAPLQTEHGGRAIGYIEVRNRRGGPRVAGRHGIFPRQDEEALRELAFVAASAFVRNEHLGCMEKAMEMAPGITACRREEEVLHKIAARLGGIIRTDHVLVFALDEDGYYVQVCESAHSMRSPNRLSQETPRRIS
jgi:hypothetical protein